MADFMRGLLTMNVADFISIKHAKIMTGLVTAETECIVYKLYVSERNVQAAPVEEFFEVLRRYY